MPESPIYLDHHATTPCDPRVVNKMLPLFSEHFGNPASLTHLHGRRAAVLLDEARSIVAESVGARSDEIYFLAGATEANNLVVHGLGFGSGDHIVVSKIEHKSVAMPIEAMTTKGVAVTWLGTDHEGFVSPDELRDAIRPETRLVSVMAANGEIGTIQPLREIGAVCRERGVPFHTDATQAVGKMKFNVEEIGCAFASFSSHKFYGPKGSGVLYARRGSRLRPGILGGGQERGMRSGTVNVPGAVGLAEALRIRVGEMEAEGIRLTEMRNRLWDRLTSGIDEVVVHGPRQNRLPGNLNVSFMRTESEALMIALRRFSLSSGSACSSGDREPSPVLKAIGASDAAAFGSIRFGLGKSNSEQELDLLFRDIEQSVSKLREISAA
ncbi:MAG TPA: cysteine desulfurase family protein [Thermoanaerobaculia bacterium]|nr:cysteine desulfurase family protein [Thermoanaerobaculia bacterium]